MVFLLDITSEENNVFAEWGLQENLKVNPTFI